MVIQSDVYTIILLTIIIGIAIVVLSKKIDALDPLEKPKGIYAAVFAGVEMVSNTVTTNTGKDNAAKFLYYGYIYLSVIHVHYLVYHLQLQILALHYY